MKKFALDLNKLFPAAGASDDWSKSLPADVVKYVVGDVGKGAPIDPKDAHLFIK